MNLADVIVILIVLLFTFWGFKRGVIKTLVQLVGTCAVLVLAWVFKDSLANLLMKFLPFFDFGGIFTGITSMNIVIYELISFVVIYILLYSSFLIITLQKYNFEKLYIKYLLIIVF